ncbi:MAG: SDR family oxidoreductase [Actinomycetota bacterium]|nr:SDR family oxidoreductase [Actinomycetota bacterium]
MPDSNTIFITGASSGIGRATAEHFQRNGWNVVATMRNPDDGAQLASLPRVLVVRLDVTDHPSIDAAVAAGLQRFGRIDVLFNNAGYGAYGPLEAFPMDRIERQFDTNVMGLIATTKAVLPHFRANRSGFIVNVSSVGGQVTFPLGALYHGTKFAVEGISEALHFEMAAIGVKVKIIEPGLIATDFGGRSFDFVNDESLTEYQTTVAGVMRGFTSGAGEATPPSAVAEVVWDSVTDGTDTLRYRAGADAVALLDSRKALDDATFFAAIKSRMGLA